MNNQPVDSQSDKTRLTGEFLDELEVEFLYGVPVKLPEQTKQQIIAWHETEKQKAQFKELTSIGKLYNGSKKAWCDYYEERYNYLKNKGNKL